MKKPTDTCTINVTNFPISMRRELKIIAAQEERPYNQIILEAVDDWLKKHRQEEGCNGAD